MEAPVEQPIPPRAVLQAEINALVAKGFRVLSQTETSAQLVKPKKFSFWWALFWFLWLGIGVLVYVFYYASKRDQNVYLVVDESGQVIRR